MWWSASTTGLSPPRCRMIGGQRAEDLGSKWIKNYHAVQQKWVELLEPGLAPPVDVFPILSLVPEMFAGWKKKARVVREGMHQAYEAMMVHAKRKHDDAYDSGRSAGDSNL